MILHSSVSKKKTRATTQKAPETSETLLRNAYRAGVHLGVVSFHREEESFLLVLRFSPFSRPSSNPGFPSSPRFDVLYVLRRFPAHRGRTINGARPRHRSVPVGSRPFPLRFLDNVTSLASPRALLCVSATKRRLAEARTYRHDHDRVSYV